MLQAVLVPEAAIDAPGFGVKPALSQPPAKVLAIPSGLVDRDQSIAVSRPAVDVAVKESSPDAIVTAKEAAWGVLPNQEQLSASKASVAPVVAPT